MELANKHGVILELLRLITNDPQFFEILQQLTGCGPMGYFGGRVHQMMSGCGHYDSWHNDWAEDRMLAMSINLSTEIYAGGLLQIRDRRSKQVVHEVSNVGFGDDIVFRLAD